jgi:hypothetical protein
MHVNKQPKKLAALLVCLLVLSVSGCTTSYDLIETGAAAIELATSGDSCAAITDVNLTQNGDCLIISGSVQERSNAWLPADYDAHVDVAVFAPDGKLAQKRSLRISLEESSQSAFEVRFPYIADRGTLVRFAYHSDRRLAEGVPNCGQNAAAEAGA